MKHIKCVSISMSFIPCHISKEMYPTRPIIYIFSSSIFFFFATRVKIHRLENLSPHKECRMSWDRGICTPLWSKRMVLRGCIIFFFFFLSMWQEVFWCLNCNRRNLYIGLKFFGYFVVDGH